MRDPTLPEDSRSWTKYIVLGVLSFLLLMGLGVGGVLFFVFYQMKDSEAARIAVQVLQESPAARERLGEIEETGWPLGSFSIDAGGAGQADFSMSVKGSQAKGKYYASLRREHGVWHYRSGRLALADGRSWEIEDVRGSGPSPVSGPTRVAGRDAESGGRALRKDAETGAWRETDWPEQPIRFKTPTDWQVLDLENRSVEFRPEDRLAYFVANLTYFDQKIPYENLFPSLLQKSAHQLERGEILGFARKNLGKAQGLLELQRRGDGQTTAAWTGYFDDEKYGTISLTILLGAPTPEAFDRAEPVLGAILESVQVK